MDSSTSHNKIDAIETERRKYLEHAKIYGKLKGKDREEKWKKIINEEFEERRRRAQRSDDGTGLVGSQTQSQKQFRSTSNSSFVVGIRETEVAARRRSSNQQESSVSSESDLSEEAIGRASKRAKRLILEDSSADNSGKDSMNSKIPDTLSIPSNESSSVSSEEEARIGRASKRASRSVLDKSLSDSSDNGSMGSQISHTPSITDAKNINGGNYLPSSQTDSVAARDPRILEDNYPSDASSIENNAALSDSNEESVKKSSSSDIDDLDMEYDDDQTIAIEVETIRKSKLGMTIQGFRAKRVSRIPPGPFAVRRESLHSIDFDPDHIDLGGKTFRKGKCYTYSESNFDSILGIKRFLPNKEVICVLIVAFVETIIGQSSEGYEYQDTLSTSYVQVEEALPPLSLLNFGGEASEMIEDIPALVYQPQTTGNWHSFGYSLDPSRLKRQGLRSDFRAIEGFVGLGGMAYAIHKAGFRCLMAVDKNIWAITSLTKNLQVPVFPGDFSEFLKYAEANPTQFGKVEYFHCSPPCQGFSGANRLGGRNDDKNNNLSLTFVEGVRTFRPLVATFENVLGMWRRKHIRYLKTMVRDLMQLGYQVRCAKLTACDYGDPQKRPRLFIMATHPSLPPPMIPPPTHGIGDGLLPFVTVKDALGGLDPTTLVDTDTKSTSLQPGQHGLVRLDPDELAPSIRASGLPPFHYDEDRCVSVGECKALQSFPVDYVTCGPLDEKYKLVGNAVPIGLGTAVLERVKALLKWKYAGEAE